LLRLEIFILIIVPPKGGGCVKQLENQTIPNPSVNIKWKLYASVEDGNLLYTTVNIFLGLFAKNNPTVLGSFWKDLPLPKLQVIFLRVSFWLF
jgi:hypothetical protein